VCIQRHGRNIAVLLSAVEYDRTKKLREPESIHPNESAGHNTES